MDDSPSDAARLANDGSEPLRGLPSYKELKQTVTKIEAVIGKYDPLDLIASLALENLVFSTASTCASGGLLSHTVTDTELAHGSPDNSLVVLRI